MDQRDLVERAKRGDHDAFAVLVGATIARLDENMAGNGTRSSLSWDGTRLHFGRDGDIFVSARSR